MDRRSFLKFLAAAIPALKMPMPKSAIFGSQERMVLDLHIIQNIPPGCPNRDENGMPKSVIFGSRRRDRISSQCWKKAILAKIKLLPEIQACSKFAHSFSTHEVQDYLDFWIATGDLVAIGAMETVFSPSIHYRYANLHLGPYLKDTNGMAEAGFQGFLEAVVKALPTGNQNSFAAYSPLPDFVLGVVRTCRPMSLANAFHMAVPDVRGQDMVQSSIEALAAYFSRLSKVSGVKEEQKAAFFVTMREGIKIAGALEIPSFKIWVEKLWEAVRPAAPSRK